MKRCVLEGRVRWAVPFAVAVMVVAVVILFVERPGVGPPAAPRESSDVGSPEDSGEVSDGPDPLEDPPSVASFGADEHRGVVVHAFTDEPIAGATLTVDPSWFGRSGNVITTKTDAAGAFRWRETPGVGWFRISHPGFVSRLLGLRPPPERIRLSPGVRVTGEVIDLSGNPVSRGEVVILESVSVQDGGFDAAQSRSVPYQYHGRESTRVALDAQGRFEVTVGSRAVLVQARSEGHGPGASELVTIAAGKGTHVVVRLSAPHTLRGRVVDRDERGISGARVRASSAPAGRDPDRFHTHLVLEEQTTTGADGSFALPDLAEMCRSVVVEHPEHALVRIREVLRTDEPQTITMESARWLAGRLVDPDGPVAARAADFATDGSNRTVPVEITDGGMLRSDPLAPEVARGELRVPGYVPVSLSWEPGSGAVELGDVSLDRGAALAVHVAAEGKPIEGALVAAGHEMTGMGTRSLPQRNRTDLTGTAMLRGLKPASTWVEVLKSGYEPWGQAVAVDVREVTAELRLQGGLEGVVVDGEDRPLFGVLVSARVGTANGSWRSFDGTSSPDGRFLIEPIPAAKPLDLTLSGVGIPRVEMTVEPLTSGELRDLGPLTIDAGVYVRGVVTDDREGPITDALISIQPQSRGFVQAQWIRTGTDGTFETTLGPGRYTLRAMAEGWIESDFRPIDVQDTDIEGLRFSLGQGVAVSGRVVTESGAPVSGAEVVILPQSRNGWSGGETLRTGADGVFEHPQAPATDLSVRVSHADYRDFHARYARAEEVPSDLTLLPATRLDVHLETEDGSALSRRGELLLTQEHSSRSSGRQIVDGVLSSRDIAPGIYTLVVSVDGFPQCEAMPVELIEGQVTRVDVIVPARVPPLVVRVESPAGAPVPGAQVHVYLVRERGWSRKDGGQTDTEGCYSYAKTVSTNMAVVASAAGYSPGIVEAALEQARDDRLLVRLEPESAIDVSVFEPDGSPANDVVVDARRDEREYGFREDSRTRDGQTRIGGLQAGDFKLRFQRGGQRLGRLDASVARGEVVSVEFRLAPEIEITGAVFLNDAPVSEGGILIRGGDLEARSTVQPDGGFRATIRGTGRLEFSYSGKNGARYTSTVEVTGPQEVELRFASGRVVGHILESDRSPLPGIEGRVGRQRFRTDNAGAFSVDDLPAGEHNVYLEGVPSGLFAPRPVVEVPPRAEVHLEIVCPPSRTLTIPVSVASGEAPSRVSRTAIFADGSVGYLQPAAVGGDGFLWPDGDDVRLRVSARGFVPRELPVARDQSLVSVVLEPGARLTVRIRDRAGDPLSEQPFRIEALGDTPLPEYLQSHQTRTNGTRLITLPAGPVHVLTTLPDGDLLEKAVQLEVGQEIEVELP